jgi:hypothetical protein
MTYIETNFSADGRYSKMLKSDDYSAKRIRMLYNIFMSLSEPARCEVDGMAQAIEEQKFRSMGFLSNFELAIKLMMYKADARQALEIFGEIERIAKGGEG